jgi:hypothetical protein
VYGPQLLPGGEWLLFTLAKILSANRWNDADLVVQSLKSGERRVLRSGGFDARYLPSGYITYAFQNVLFASTFDAKTLKLDDERVALVEGVQSAFAAPAGGSSFYAVSNNGTLVFVPGSAGSNLARPQRTLVWVDRDGKTQPLPLRPDNYTIARLSPDGTRIALVVGSTLPATDPPPDIYVYDLKTENLTQLTFNPQADDAPRVQGRRGRGGRDIGGRRHAGATCSLGVGRPPDGMVGLPGRRDAAARQRRHAARRQSGDARHRERQVGQAAARSHRAARGAFAVAERPMAAVLRVP